MRQALLARSLVIGAALAILATTGLPRALAGKGNKQAAPASSFTKDIDGLARWSREDAQESALEVARDEIATYLQEQKPPFIWKPDTTYVREHLLEDLPEASGTEWSRGSLNQHTILVKEMKKDEADQEPTYQVRLRLIVSTQELARMRQLDQPYRETMRHAAVQQRQLWLGKVLLGVVALLAALSGYIRLEDATKGYYTGWLRLGMVGVLSAVGAGLWLVS